MVVQIDSNGTGHVDEQGKKLTVTVANLAKLHSEVNSVSDPLVRVYFELAGYLGCSTNLTKTLGLRLGRVLSDLRKAPNPLFSTTCS